MNNNERYIQMYNMDRHLIASSYQVIFSILWKRYFDLIVPYCGQFLSTDLNTGLSKQHPSYF